jgi:PHD/YefM family antitoxin component YafN of YafNO toxin-antitoxin module
MRGIQFIVDNRGKKKAVVIDLKEWGDLWEDIYDIMVSEIRKKEPVISWTELKAEMEKGQEDKGKDV